MFSSMTRCGLLKHWCGSTNSQGFVFHCVQIRSERPQLDARRLRLIHSGRMLPNETSLHSWISAQDERHRKSKQFHEDELEEALIMHCSVGPQVESNEEENDDGSAQVRGRQSAQTLHSFQAHIGRATQTSTRVRQTCSGRILGSRYRQLSTTIPQSVNLQLFG